MSTTPNPVTMIDPQGTARVVPADAVSQAPADWKPATKMTDPQGTARWVPTEAVTQARQANYSVTPDNPGVQRMATPQGQLTYALPSEVDSFKASGHVPIDDSGNFRVDPLPGEQNTDTMDRAARIAKGLPPDVLQKAIAAEKKTITPARVAANLTVGPAAAAAVGLAPVIGANEAYLAAPAVIGTVGPPLMRAVGTGVALAKTPLGKTALKYTLGAGGLTGTELLASYIKKKLGL